MTRAYRRSGSAQLFRKRADLGRLARFAGVGALGTATYYLSLVVLVEILAAPVLVATSISFVLVVLQNYVLHYAWTFDSNSPHHVALPRFVVMSIAGFLINGSVMWLGVEQLGFNYLFVQAIAIAIVIVWNLTLSHTWIFREQDKVIAR